MQVDYELAPGSLRSAKEIFPASLVRASGRRWQQQAAAGQPSSRRNRPARILSARSKATQADYAGLSHAGRVDPAASAQAQPSARVQPSLLAAWRSPTPSRLSACLLALPCCNGAGREGGAQLPVRGGGAVAAQGAVGDRAGASAGNHPSVPHSQPAVLHAAGGLRIRAGWIRGGSKPVLRLAMPLLPAWICCPAACHCGLRPM